MNKVNYRCLKQNKHAGTGKAAWSPVTKHQQKTPTNDIEYSHTCLTSLQTGLRAYGRRPGVEISKGNGDTIANRSQLNEDKTTTHHDLQKYEEDENEHRKRRHEFGINPKLIRWISEDPTRLAKAREDMARWTRYMKTPQQPNAPNNIGRKKTEEGKIWCL